jgi:hypothetical protein
VTLRELLDAATPPSHGENTWEEKRAWDNYNQACSDLEAKTRDMGRLLLDMADALRVLNGAHDGLPVMERNTIPFAGIAQYLENHELETLEALLARVDALTEQDTT